MEENFLLRNQYSYSWKTNLTAILTKKLANRSISQRYIMDLSSSYVESYEIFTTLGRESVEFLKMQYTVVRYM